jgi:hypothetical protein
MEMNEEEVMIARAIREGIQKFLSEPYIVIHDKATHSGRTETPEEKIKRLFPIKVTRPRVAHFAGCKYRVYEGVLQYNDGSRWDKYFEYTEKQKIIVDLLNNPTETVEE